MGKKRREGRGLVGEVNGEVGVGIGVGWDKLVKGPGVVISY